MYRQSVITQCKNARHITIKLPDSIPSIYGRVYVVCESYEKASIQSAKRQTCKYRKRCIFKNPDLKVPYKFNIALSLAPNKEALCNILNKGFQCNYQGLYNLFLFLQWHANQTVYWNNEIRSQMWLRGSWHEEVA